MMKFLRRAAMILCIVGFLAPAMAMAAPLSTQTTSTPTTQAVIAPQNNLTLTTHSMQSTAHATNFGIIGIVGRIGVKIAINVASNEIYNHRHAIIKYLDGLTKNWHPYMGYRGYVIS